MAKKFFLLAIMLAIPFCFALDCSSISSSDLGKSWIDYSAMGSVILNFDDYEFENFSFSFRGIPQIGIIDSITNGMISHDGFNNSMIFFHYPEISQNLYWHFNASLYNEAKNEKIRVNPPFPYTGDFPSDILMYLEFSKTADEDIRIKLKANELVRGASDYLTAIARISEFAAYSIEYDLSYAARNDKASEIFDSRRGVCTEYSTLLISLLRSIGIPARYVSGYAFTNIGQKSCNNFEAHSWIQAYVPNYGWINIDPTYREFFSINSGHVPLYVSNDLIDISNLYLLRKGSQDSDFLIDRDYSFNLEITGFSSKESDIGLAVDAPLEIAQDSYLLVNVTLSNPHNFWILDTLNSIPIQGIELLNYNHSIPVIIPPNSDLKRYFIFKIPDLECASSCYSLALFKFYLGDGAQDSAQITIDSELEDESNLNSLLELAKEEEIAITSGLIVSNAKFNKARFLSQNPVLSFYLKNIGNSALDVDFSIKYAEKEYFEKFENLLINEQRFIEMEIELPNQKGIIDAILEFSYEDEKTQSNLSFIALKEPEYEITAEKSDEFSYSISIPSENNISGNFIANLNGEKIHDFSFSSNSILAEFEEKDFMMGENEIEFIFDYSDNGEYYFKSIKINQDFSLDILGQILRFFDAIKNFFVIILSA